MTWHLDAACRGRNTPKSSTKASANQPPPTSSPSATRAPSPPNASHGPSATNPPASGAATTERERRRIRRRDSIPYRSVPTPAELVQTLEARKQRARRARAAQRKAST